MNKKFRLLLVDDNHDIHKDFMQILGSNKLKSSKLQDLDLFLDDVEVVVDENESKYLIDSAFQGEDAINMVKKAIDLGKPYSLIFMDVRMPPGIDGVEASKLIWEIDPNVEIVICTAFSDYSFDTIIDTLGITDKLLFLKKPFDSISIKQHALAITKKWELAYKDRQHIEDLEDIIAKRTSDIMEEITITKKAEADLKKKNKEIFEFTNMITHDLKKPLSSIKMMSFLLKKGNFGELNKNGNEAIETLDESILYMEQMLEDLLLSAKIESVDIKANLENIQLLDFINHIVENFSILCKEKGISIKVSNMDFELISDRKILTHIFSNLLGNSIDYMKDNCDKEIIIGSNIDNGIREFFVSDNGIGIASEEKERIFSRFYRGSNSNGIQGTGLGLDIVKNSVKKLGGNINLISELGKGSLFSFTIDSAV